jgi:hypothetical protein
VKFAPIVKLHPDAFQICIVSAYDRLVLCDFIPKKIATNVAVNT